MPDQLDRLAGTLADLNCLLVRDLEGFRREIELFPDEGSLWRTLPGITNPAGTLALHVCGGLKHFVGAVLGRTGYVRDRDAEFSRRDARRADLLDEIASTIAIVTATLGRLPPDLLSQPYPVAVNNVRPHTGLFLLHLATHLTFHLGQAGYLRRALTGSATASGAVSVAALAVRPAVPDSSPSRRETA